MSQNHYSLVRDPGSAILREFRAAMEAKRAGLGAAVPHQPMAQQRRSFAAARSTRLMSGWSTHGAALNAILEGALPVLRARSRAWSRDDEHGKHFLTMVDNGMVGPNGITLQMACGDWARDGSRWVFKLDKLANDAIEAAWLKWCAKGVCEVTGKLDFITACRVSTKHLARDGEFLLRHIRGTKDNEFGYQIQLLQPERLDERKNHLPMGDENEIRMGVERDSKGRAVAYHILRRNPSDNAGLTMQAAERVPAKDVSHEFIMLEAEQVRGVPWSHAVLLGANMLHKFEESAVFAAHTGASHMGFYTQQLGEGGPNLQTPQELGATEEGDKLLTEMEPGALELLPPGIDFKSFDPKYPTEAFDPFTKNRKRSLAVGLDVANHNFTGDMSGVNYSSARIAELSERDNWRSLGGWFVGSKVHVVFRNWLEMSLLSRAIRLPDGTPLPVSKFEKYLAGAKHRTRGWEWVDPDKETKAMERAVNNLFRTRSQVVAASGGNFEDNVIERAQEDQILKDNNVTLTPAVSTPATPDKEDDDANDEPDKT